MKISESCILSIQFYVGSKFCVINTIPPDLLDLANFKLQEKEKKLRSATTVLNLSKPRNSRSRQSKLHRGSGLFCTKAPYKEGNLKCQITKTDTEIECFSYYFSYRRIQDLQSFWGFAPKPPTRALPWTH